MTQYISYIRVSTDKQGASGLGLEAQRTTIAKHVKDGEIVAEYVEVESGRKAERPQLAAALRHAKEAKATLVIAKLDRLARNLFFISGLMNAGVEFVACDLPQASKFTLHIMAAFAEHEATLISERTKAALAAAKARGVKLGPPDGRNAAIAREVAREEAEARNILAREAIKGFRRKLTLLELAQVLEGKGIKTPRGGTKWSPTQVRRLKM